MTLPRDIQHVFKEINRMVAVEVAEKGQMTLGRFIAELEKAPADHRVDLDFCNLTPTELMSYRGYYDHLAIGFSEDGHATVADVLADARAAMGRTFQGYKGGDYIMHENTPIWVSNYGNSASTRAVGVRVGKYCTKILTATDDED